MTVDLEKEGGYADDDTETEYAIDTMEKKEGA